MGLVVHYQPMPFCLFYCYIIFSSHYILSPTISDLFLTLFIYYTYYTN